MKKMKMKTDIPGFFQPTKMTVIALLLQTSFFLFSFMPKGSEKSGGAVRKELTFVSFFQRVTINGDFSVLLTNDPAGTVMVEGDENDVDNIRVKTRNNDLVINMNKKKNLVN